MPLRSCDLEAHYTQELDYLAKLSAALIVSQQNQQNVSAFYGTFENWAKDNYDNKDMITQTNEFIPHCIIIGNEISNGWRSTWDDPRISRM